MDAAMQCGKVLPELDNIVNNLIAPTLKVTSKHLPSLFFFKGASTLKMLSVGF